MAPAEEVARLIYEAVTSTMLPEERHPYPQDFNEGLHRLKLMHDRDVEQERRLTELHSLVVAALTSENRDRAVAVSRGIIDAWLARRTA